MRKLKTQNSIHSASSGLSSTLSAQTEGMLSKAEASKLKRYSIDNWKLVIGNSPSKISYFGGRGWSLIELLVVVAVFAIVSLLATQALIHSLRGSRKSESLARVRSDLDFALAVIERNLHNATDIDPCPNPPDTITYTDQLGDTTFFSCVTIGGLGAIASGSATARLTSDETDVTSCSFVCTPGDVGVPPSVTVSVIAEDPNAVGAEGAQVTTQTDILLRIY